MSRRAQAPERTWVHVSWPLPFAVETAVDVLDRLATAHLGPMVWEATASGGRIHHRVGMHPASLPAFSGILRELLPLIQIAPVNREDEPVVLAGRVALSRPQLALGVDRLTATVRAVLASLAMANRPEETVTIQLLLGSTLPPRLSTRADSGWWQVLTGAADHPVNQIERARLATRAALHGFRAHLRIGARAESPARGEQLLRAVLASLRVAETSATRVRFTQVPVRRFIECRRPCHYLLGLSAREVLAVIGWPVGELPLPGTGSGHPKRLLAPAGISPDRAFAVTDTSHGETPVGLPLNAAPMNTYVLGPIGSAKSTVMLSLALDAAREGRALLMVDPKGDLVREFLERVDEKRRDDIVVVDPTAPRPVGLDILHDAGRDPQRIADTLLATFRSLFADNWGIRSESVISNALLELTRRPGSTLVELPLLLTDASYRKRFRVGADDPLGTGQFWRSYDELSAGAQATLIGPALTKLQQVLLRPAVRHTIGQQNPAFRLSELYTHRRIVLVSLNRGVLGEAAALIGSLIVSQWWLLTLERATLPPARRHLVDVYLDEVHEFLRLPGGELETAMSMGRALGVAIHVAHQYRRQLTEDLRAAFDSSARSKIVFGLNQPDAGDIARYIPNLDAEDFTSLPRFHAYTTLMRPEGPSPWFSIRTRPPARAVRDAADLVAASTERYGRDARDVEASLRSLLNPMPTEPSRQDDAPVGRKRAEP